ncbi:hypothetical protein FHR32_004025 [Streptosporangium album]|uniref:Lipoprotein n=1 Tax=Streptosporangium album TaxID=47479 RepID=A0A7W7WB02_9ACTN|nr:hypothetical protein [Streptosporangium album]MBB4939720.1 hypothetical protein [Streptosporangium album]
MKRHIAGLACAATAVLSVSTFASAAHAQAADPVTALKGEFTSGRGVSFAETTKIHSSGGNAVVAQRKGVFQFGTSGISASDQTGKLRIKQSDLGGALEESDGEEDDTFSKMLAGMAKPERVIRIKNTSYVSGGMLGEFIPAEKTWVRLPMPMMGMVGSVSQYVNAAEPATLKALLAHATTKRAGLYGGKITFGELDKVSPWFRASMPGRGSGKAAKTVVSWKLFLGADRLATRLTTTYAMPGMSGSTMTVDTRYTGWGSKVTVKAPAAEEVAELKELQEGGEEATSIPLLGN